MKDVPRTPWMRLEEIDLICGYLQPTHRMLEYGSGGSTLIFAPRVREYVSIEHDPDWYEAVAAQAPGNVRLHLLRPNLPGSRPSTYAQYRDYVDHVARLGLTFDRVLIDGRARPECARAVAPFLAADAVIFMHDFWDEGREYYHRALRWYDEVESAGSLVVLRAKTRQPSFRHVAQACWQRLRGLVSRVTHSTGP